MYTTGVKVTPSPFQPKVGCPADHLYLSVYQDQDSKWTRSGYIEKYCWSFWKMAAIEVKQQICDGPIAK